MSDRNRKSNQFIPGWPTSHAPKPNNESIKTSSIHEESLDLVQINDLQQGQLYIIKIKLIAIGLFQGWDDEMCCFTILRTDLLEDLRWSEARYLPENFDAYLAFDYAGNPPIHLWTKHLRAVIPINWFNIFEEARHMQRQWHVSYWDAPAIEDTHTNKPFYNLTDPPIEDLTEEENDEENKITEAGSNEEKSLTEEPEEEVIKESAIVEVVVPKTTTTTTTTTTTAIRQYSPQQQQKNNRSIVSESQTSNAFSAADITTTPAMRLQKQYNNKNLVVTQQQQQQEKQTEVIVDNKPKPIINTAIIAKPEVKQRRSFTSFFLKKKKSKKSLNSNSDESSLKQNRKSAPPTPSIDRKHHFKISESELSEKFKQEISSSSSPSPPELTKSSNSSTKNQESSSPTLKTPKNEKVSVENDKLELYDLDNYFDMQATFAFLNNSKPDTFSLLDNKKSTISN
ncbi:hypothetical protein BD770DRAFT_399570 [Pilaira anomala]|nr:hypothetical protein BD770DRAFT_399570 [Pilaira anomala]